MSKRLLIATSILSIRDVPCSSGLRHDVQMQQVRYSQVTLTPSHLLYMSC